MAQERAVKDRIIEMLSRLPDDADYDRMIESIFVMQRIDIGLRECESGKGTDHQEFMQELLTDDDPVSRHLDATG